QPKRPPNVGKSTFGPMAARFREASLSPARGSPVEPVSFCLSGCYFSRLALNCGHEPEINAAAAGRRPHEIAGAEADRDAIFVAGSVARRGASRAERLAICRVARPQRVLPDDPDD